MTAFPAIVILSSKLLLLLSIEFFQGCLLISEVRQSCFSIYFLIVVAMKNACHLIFILSFVLLYSCKKDTGNEGNEGNIPVLKSSLEETKTSFFDLFKSAELIPLETTDQSLMKGTRKLDCYHDTLYVFDDDLYALFIFDNDGKYINKIHRVGDGPGEYVYVYDFYLNREERIIEMLSPSSIHYRYGFDTGFIKSYHLPSPPKSTQRLEYWDENTFSYWSMLAPDTTSYGDYGRISLNLVSLETTKNVGSFYVRDYCVTQLYSSHPFYRYDNQLFFLRPFSNDVYLLTKNGPEVAYTWDFGDKTMTIDVLNYKYPESPDINEVHMKFYKMFEAGDIPEAPYCYVFQNQTDQYYYTKLRFPPRIYKNLFYNKETHQTLFFEKTIEGISFNPIYFTNEYLIFVIEPDQKELILPVLTTDTEKEKWAKIEDTDNPVLVKCYFK
jgi:hypothetical protein